jgi:tetratricopeptide (TPR) repeat protein
VDNANRALRSGTDKTLLLLAIALALVTVMVYLPSLRNGYVYYDDSLYITMNRSITHLDLSFVRWAFSTFQYYNWQPLTWISFALDHALWGDDPFGYHLTNAFLHAANTFLVMILVARLFSAAGQRGSIGVYPPERMLITAGTTAFLFGIHPLHVESVAWLGERKDVLYALFYLLALLAYLSYAATSSRDRRFRYYGVCLLLFGCSAMSKAMAVTLPVLMILLDLFPLRRVRGSRKEKLRVLVLEKVPFFLISAVVSVLAFTAQQLGGAVQDLGVITPGERVLAAFRAGYFYLEKTLVPRGLAPFYPTFLPITVEAHDLAVVAAYLAIVVSCFWTARRSWFLVSLWSSYFVTLLPVLGLVKVGSQSAADRYAYLAMLGPLLLIGLAVALTAERLGRRFSRSTGWLFVFCIALTMSVVLSILTIRQISVWKDDVTLWSREVEVYPYSVPLGYIYRADAYFRRGMTEQAVADYSIALQVDPRNSEAYYKRGNLFYITGRMRLAAEDFTQALLFNPDLTEARYYKQLAEKALHPR